MAADLEQLVLSISADTRQAVRALKKFGVDVENVANDAEAVFRRPKQPLDDLSKSLGKNQVQTANLAAQFQDIAVQLQGGQSPFQIALQQGSQISAALGPGRGLGGTVAALGSAFLSVVSPVSLATIALITLGGIGVQYLMGVGKEAETLEDKLKAHKDLIASIKDAYGEALDGVELYAMESTSVLQAQARASALALGAALQTEIKSALGSAGRSFIDPSDIIGDKELFAVKDRFAQFGSAILSLRQSVQDGTPDIRAFRSAVAEIANSDPSNKKLQELAGELIKLTDEANKVDNALTATQRAISATADMASGSVGAINAYRSALEGLAKVALPTLTPRQQALEQFRSAVGAAGGQEERVAAQQAYAEALKRVGAEEKKVEDERNQRDAERDARRGARKGERDQERIDDVIKRLQLEQEQIGRTAREQAVYNAVAAAGVDINSRYGQQVAGLAANLYDLQSAQAGAIQTMDDFRSASYDVLSGFAQDIRNGVSATEALQNALGRVADRLIDIALQDSISGLFGKSGTTGGGLLGGLLGSVLGLGKASGGPVSAGRVYPVGERGPELFAPNVPGMIVPNISATPRASGGVTFAPSTTIDARGSNMSEAQIKGLLDQRDREIMRQVPGVVNASRARTPSYQRT